MDLMGNPLGEIFKNSLAGKSNIGSKGELWVEKFQ
jgi:hypothetical protein